VVFVGAADVDAAAAVGTIGWGNLGTGPVTSSLNGLTAQDNAELFYGFNATVGTVSGSALSDISSSSFFTASTTVQVYAEISWFTDSAMTDDQIFIAASNGSDSFTNPSALWISSVPVGSIAAFNAATLADFDAELATDPALVGASVAGVGMLNVSGAPIDLYNFAAGGNSFYFTPEPVATAGPATITPADLGTPGKGFTVSTTGFVPNESLSIYLGSSSNGGQIDTAVADASGAVTYTYIAPDTASALDAYTLTLVGDDSSTFQQFAFSVVAAAPALAVTGFDAAVPAVAGGVLLLGGAALALIAVKRRKNA
jgi:hypothetical protein